MNSLKTIVGLAMMAAGVVGFGVTVMVIREARTASQSLSKQTEDILDSTEEGVDFLNRGTEKVSLLLQITKEKVQSLDKILNDLSRKVSDRDSKATLLDALDEDIARRLQRAQTSVASLQSTLHGLNNTLMLFHSIPGMTPKDSSNGGKDINDAQELSQTLMEASDVLDRQSRFLNDILTDREVTKKSLDEVKSLVVEIQSKLGEAQEKVTTFQERLSRIEDRIRNSQENLPFWIEKGYVLLVIFLICFAFSQLSLILHGRSLLNQKREEKESSQVD